MATNGSIEIIKSIIEYIEENIKEKITLEDIASYSNFTKFHLLRIFKAIVNLSVMEYVRGRKLSCSINDLLNTDFKIIIHLFKVNNISFSYCKFLIINQLQIIY